MKIRRGAVLVDVDVRGNAMISTHGWAFSLQIEAADIDNLVAALAALLARRGNGPDPLPPEATGFRFECNCGATDGGVHKVGCPARTFLEP